MNCQREIKKTIPFTIASKRIKYLEINLTKGVNDLYSENDKTLMKTIQINERIYLAHGFEGLISLKCPYHPKQSKDSVQFLSKHQWYFSQN